MTPGWAFDSLPRWMMARFCDSPSRIIIKVLAALGVLIFIERAASYHALNSRVRHYTNPGGSFHPLESHPLDSILLHKGVNSGLGSFGQKALVVASISSEDTSWIQKHLSDWQDNIYVVDDKHANLTVAKHNGHEAAVYLTYIINHYYVLPDYIAFLHSQRYQWHNDDPMYDGVIPMKNIRLKHVKDTGYVSLRCAWDPGCPETLHPDPDYDDGFFGMTAAYAHAFGFVFPDRDLPEIVAAPCCAQFVVTKETITKTPLQTWQRAKQWLWENDIGDHKSGRVMEYMWHILMGEAATSCPNAQECYCKTFGLCDLQCEDPAGCQGRYRLPNWNERLPEGWPFEGQGANGWPEYGWWQEWYPSEDFGLSYIESGSGADIIDLPNTDESITDIAVDPDELVTAVMDGPLSEATETEPDLQTLQGSTELDELENENDDTDDTVVSGGAVWFLDEVVGKNKNNETEG